MIEGIGKRNWKKELEKCKICQNVFKIINTSLLKRDEVNDVIMTGH
jgi:hypothetical protein